MVFVFLVNTLEGVGVVGVTPVNVAVDGGGEASDEAVDSRIWLE